VSTPPTPGDRGYGAYWKRQVRKAGLAKLRGLPENISGRALLAVLTAFGDHIDNRSGEAWPSQAALAEESGQGKRTVERGMKAGQRLGWLAETAPPVPRVKGTTYLATVPGLVSENGLNSSPAGEESGSRLVATSAPTHRQCDDYSSPVSPELVVSSGEQTLTLNSHVGTPIEELRPLTGAQELSGEDNGGKEVSTQDYTENVAESEQMCSEEFRYLLDLREEAYKKGQTQSDFGLADLRRYRPWLFASSSD
jgi:hypothetical protein